MEELDLINAIINGGGTAVLVYMMYDMRKEQREQALRFWALFEYLVRSQGIDPKSIPRG